MTTVKLTDEQLDLVRRAMMKEACTDLRHAGEQLDALGWAGRRDARAVGSAHADRGRRLTHGRQ